MGHGRGTRPARPRTNARESLARPVARGPSPGRSARAALGPRRPARRRRRRPSPPACSPSATAAGSPRGAGDARAPAAGRRPRPPPTRSPPCRPPPRPGRTTPAGWATLGLAYVQQARLTADPSYYARAEQAFTRSLQVEPDRNDEALDRPGHARRRPARLRRGAAPRPTPSLAVNDYSPTTYGVRVDALTELGRYDEALAAVQRMLDLRTGVDSLARASYQTELRGDVDRARELLQQAADAGRAPADLAFAEHYLGELAWNAGDLDGRPRRLRRRARRRPRLPARRSPAAPRCWPPPARPPAALADYQEAVQRQPQPPFLVELGTLLEADGQQQAAQAQYDVVRATQQLFAAQGADVDLELALFEADHGDPATALRYAPEGLPHAPGRRARAGRLRLGAAPRRPRRARRCRSPARALRLGTRLPALQYHLGRHRRGRRRPRPPPARALTAALTLNPRFDPLQAPQARRLLGQLR